jgi:hypothetical protein
MESVATRKVVVNVRDTAGEVPDDDATAFSSACDLRPLVLIAANKSDVLTQKNEEKADSSKGDSQLQNAFPQ